MARKRFRRSSESKCWFELKLLFRKVDFPCRKFKLCYSIWPIVPLKLKSIGPAFFHIILWYIKKCYGNLLRNCLQTLGQFKPSNKLLVLLTSSENLWFSDDLRGNRSWFIRWHLLLILRTEIWKHPLRRLNSFMTEVPII